MDMVAGAGGIFGQLAVGLAGGLVPDLSATQLLPNRMMMAKQAPKPTVDSLPDKVRKMFKGLSVIATFVDVRQVLLRIFTYLSHREILSNALVCKKWHMISQDPRLWMAVSLRPEISGLHVDRPDVLLKLIPSKFKELRYLEITTELITPQVT